MGFRSDQLEIRPSRRLRGALLGLHAAALVALLLSRLEGGWLLGGGLLLAHAFWIDARLGRLQAPGAIRGVRWDPERLWLRHADTGWQPCEPQSGALLLPALLLVELRTAEDQRHRLLLFPDAVGVDGFRRLQVVLRYRLSSRQPQS